MIRVPLRQEPNEEERPEESPHRPRGIALERSDAARSNVAPVPASRSLAYSRQKITPPNAAPIASETAKRHHSNRVTPMR